MPNDKKLAFLQLEVEVILKSGLLLEDDSHFLESLAFPLDNICEKPLWTEISLLHGILVCGTIFIWKKEVVHGLFPFLYSFLAAEHFFSNWHFSVQRSRVSDAVKRLLGCCKDLLLLQKKSLNFVQENELLFRGFTLAKTSSSVLNFEHSVVPCLAKRWYVMSGLRMSIAQSALQAINVMQDSVKALIMMCPLSGHLDKKNHYLAYLSVEELGIAEIDTTEDFELPLGMLKKLHHVYCLLQSEFLRRLALCFVVKFWKDVGQNILSVLTIINEVSNKYHELLSILNQDYKFFSGYGLNAVNDTYIKTPTKRNSWRYFGAYVGIHSACLHLQGMLHRAKEMEELIQVQSDENEVADNSTLSRNVTGVLTDIVTEINSCKSCLEVAISELVNKPPTPHSTLEICDSLTKNVSEEKQKPVVVGVTDLDPQIEDEVFEALISHDNLLIGCEDDDDDCYFVSMDATDEVRRTEKECSDRMLLELKTVLVHKAHEWEKREAKALKRASQNAERAGTEDKAVVEPSGNDMQSNTGQGSNGEAPERTGAHFSLDEQSNQANIVASAPEIVKSGSNVVNDDSLTSLVIKPTETWPLPRLKREMYSLSGSSSSCNVEMCNSFLDRAEQVETLIAGAATFQPKYLGCDVDEETFIGSGENSSSSESENNEQ
jgi:hypothetical protein